MIVQIIEFTKKNAQKKECFFQEDQNAILRFCRLTNWKKAVFFNAFSKKIVRREGQPVNFLFVSGQISTQGRPTYWIFAFVSNGRKSESSLRAPNPMCLKLTKITVVSAKNPKIFS
eukprot:GEMP01134066.1.p1 GENE.GEMP01134066.1~~GEMP01134066.1.p1  ORF type:complete len:116 (-),score=1.74 GEMP01134066.1:143-490(-)